MSVRLSDGGDVVLPFRDPSRNDPEYDALLAAVCEAEDRSEVLRMELALTIFLLDRDYGFSADRLNALLSFEADSPALGDLQRSVHDLVVGSLQRKRDAAAAMANDSQLSRSRGSQPKGAGVSVAGPRRLGSLRLF